MNWLTELGWTAFALVGMFFVTWALAKKAEGTALTSNDPDTQYSRYGLIAKLCAALGLALIVYGWVTRTPRDSTDMMFYVGGTTFLAMGAWMIYFRNKRFPGRRWEENVIQKPPEPPL